MILYLIYSNDLRDIEIEEGFFNGWPNPPNKDKHRLILEKAYKTIVAIDSKTDKIIGFVNAISDGILSAYIPLLEVLPEYQKQGIGSELVKRMLNQLHDLYMVDLCCDKELISFYEKQGMFVSHGMIYRNYEYQRGR